MASLLIHNRYYDAERKLYTSPLIDNSKVTLIDLPGGKGLAATGIKQMELVQEFTGDTYIRWLTGSDKFISDIALVEGNAPISKAFERLVDPRVLIYVVHRKSDDYLELARASSNAYKRFGKRVEIIEEEFYDCPPASSSQIRALRMEGRNKEADRIEFFEFQK